MRRTDMPLLVIPAGIGALCFVAGWGLLIEQGALLRETEVLSSNSSVEVVNATVGGFLLALFFWVILAALGGAPWVRTFADHAQRLEQFVCALVAGSFWVAFVPVSFLSVTLLAWAGAPFSAGASEAIVQGYTEMLARNLAETHALLGVFVGFVCGIVVWIIRELIGARRAR